MKLISKERRGAKVVQKYDKPKTPYQRLIGYSDFIGEKRCQLIRQYKALDPVALLKDLQRKQEEFWKCAWVSSVHSVSIMEPINISNNIDMDRVLNKDTAVEKIDSRSFISLENYKNTRSPRKIVHSRNWRTHIDPFQKAWGLLLNRLMVNPELTSKSLLDELVREYPDDYNIG